MNVTRFAREPLWTPGRKSDTVAPVSDTEHETGSERREMTDSQRELLERVRARRVLPAPAERRRIREAADVTQRELAKALGVPQTYVWRWEQGSKPRDHQHEVAYADLLNELKRVAA
jgi:DNA-binding transcriptional regulator YiaG